MEAGCRSFNKKMPEEINRIICDHCADLLLAPDQVAYGNLKREGLDENKIHVVGSTAIEATLRNVNLARQRVNLVSEMGLSKNEFVLFTLHRAENTDDSKVLKGIVDAINKISLRVNVVFPIHPRTRNALHRDGLKLDSRVRVIVPVGNLELLSLIDNAKFVMSDSGGIQEEAGAIDTPCLILRNETEWTYLTDCGKNLLVGNDGDKIVTSVDFLLDNPQEVVKMSEIKLDLKMDVCKDIVRIIKNESKK
jgi:UDP-N-acetylglucosamine 2-epimerase (non-hydrolysing)